MKKALIFIIIIGVIIGAIVLAVVIKKYNLKKIEEAQIAEIKKGWYVEITNDFINVRKDANAYSAKIGEVFKGEVYSVMEVEYIQKDYWFKIKYGNNANGWVTSGKNKDFLVSYNGSYDFQIPILYYYETEYKVDNIEDINYDRIKVKDDNDDYTITHVVYHEYDPNIDPIIDQYWIVYTVTDASGKSSSKTQKIIFKNIPSKDKVKPWTDFKKD